MTFTTGNTLSRCSGQNHYSLDITVGAITKTLRLTLEEFQGEPPDDILEAREAIIARLRSAAREANAVTFAQVRTALESKTFKV